MTSAAELPLVDPTGSAEFEQLYRSIGPRLRRFLQAAEPREADDLAADVWLAVAGQLHRFSGDEQGFQALVFTIARRRVADHRRKRYRRRTDVVANESLADRTGAERPEAEVVERLRSRQAIDEIASRLPPAQADVILLRVVAGCSVDEVARVLSRSAGAVRILQHRALQRLRVDMLPWAEQGRRAG